MIQAIEKMKNRTKKAEAREKKMRQQKLKAMKEKRRAEKKQEEMTGMLQKLCDKLNIIITDEEEAIDKQKQIIQFQANKLKETERDLIEAQRRAIPKKVTLSALKERLDGCELLLRIPGTNQFSTDCRRLVVDLFGWFFFSTITHNIIQTHTYIHTLHIYT